jgi:putative oxidoreductase
MSLFSPASGRQINIGLTVLRIITGVIFIAHGSQKIFGMGFDGVAGGFAQMGIPMAEILGPFVALLEFFGGFALIAGLLTRLTAFGLGSTMIVAILQVHLPNGLTGQGGFELPLSLLGAAFMLALTGAGSWSVDALISRRKPAPATASAARELRRAA